MIIIKLQGGLGNQFFQYSFGRMLELKYGKEVSYDFSFFDNKHKYTKRDFVLDKFNIKPRVASVEEINQTKYKYGIISRAYYYLHKALNKFFLKKYYIGYDKDLMGYLADKDSFYLEGWWQTYVYPSFILEELKKEIKLKDFESGSFKTYLSEIDSCEAVFVHIRRGDYLQGGDNLQVLGEEYYEKAISYMQAKLISPKYFIFSDDIEWAKENLAQLFENCVFLSQDDLKDYEEFALMGSCKHGIVANSSFSWWAAFLIDSKEKIVIAPKNWNNTLFDDDAHLLPSSWVQV